MPKQEQHKHFYRYRGFDVNDPIHMLFECEECLERCDIHRGTWYYLTRGRK